MKHKVSELQGALLDAAVAKAEGVDVARVEHTEDDGSVREFCVNALDEMEAYAPSSDWMIGGPIIEREGIGVARYEFETPPEKGWRADYVEGGGYFSSLDFDHEGATPLVAAMRCFVAGRFGDEIELP